MKVIRKFISKKNNVYLVNNGTKNIIKKTFNSKDNYLKEKYYYNLLRNYSIKIPSVLAYNDESLIMIIEFLSENTVLDKLEILEKENNEYEALILLKKIFAWINIFHSIPEISSNNLAFCDLSLRNFMLKDDEVYGIDFESIDIGSLLEDTAKLIAMYLNYEKKYSQFKNNAVSDFKKYLSISYNFDIKELESTIEHEIDIIEKRRFKKNKS
jgi:tRNA A-37 threonylcarbamoyl transferase component Bud32